MNRHLKGEKESAAAEAKKSLQWWLFADSDDSEKSEKTPKSELVSQDFQVRQALNYLRSWETIQNL